MKQQNNRSLLAFFIGRHFLLLGAGFDGVASRFTAYAIATACLTGFPAATSALTLARKALGDDDLTSGIIYPF